MQRSNWEEVHLGARLLHGCSKMTSSVMNTPAPKRSQILRVAALRYLCVLSCCTALLSEKRRGDAESKCTKRSLVLCVAVVVA